MRHVPSGLALGTGLPLGAGLPLGCGLGLDRGLLLAAGLLLATGLELAAGLLLAAGLGLAAGLMLALAAGLAWRGCRRVGLALGWAQVDTAHAVPRSAVGDTTYLRCTRKSSIILSANIIWLLTNMTDRC